MSVPWRCCLFVLFAALALGEKRCPPQEVILPCRCITKGEEFQIW
jgi:hypothetical protein